MSTEIKRSILDKINNFKSDQSVLDILLSQATPPKECELWDYKLLIDDSQDSLLELCRDVISFYNSYGGYIIFGISDDRKVQGLNSFPYDEKQIKLKVQSFTSCDVVVSVEKLESDGKNVFLIFVPKRPKDVAVAVMRKDGTGKIDARPKFKLGSVYFRSDESCQLIRGSEDLMFLSTPRHHALSGNTESNSINHNLPDRTMICENFVGRSDVKSQLWVWLSDEMLRYRVIAGPGGVGKTSAAYSFATDVASSSPLGFMQVVWLSAKTKQFSAKDNAYIEMAYSGTAEDSFHDVASLLDAIVQHLPVTNDEVEFIATESEQSVIHFIQKNLASVPTFFVVDDLDSLPIDDQRRVIEIAMLVGGRQTRFLFTTRKNYTAPATSLQQLPGLSGDEFKDYVKVLEARYQRNIPASEINRLESETGGSPLFVESVFRLLKVGVKFHDAITRWKGEDGEVVRAAAFSKELEQLTINTKRALYAVSLFESASLAEIKEVAELEQPQVESAITELDQLFLLSSEQIGDEARFSTPSTLGKLLYEKRSKLVPGFGEIDRRANQLRKRSQVYSKGRGKDRYIGRVINQVMALLSDNTDAALATVNEAIGDFPSNPDLLMVKARCLAACDPIDLEAVRSAFRQSFELGKREKALFEKWIEFETRKGISNAAIDVISKAEKVLVPAPWDWLERAAAAYVKRGRERFGRLEWSDAGSDFVQAKNHLEKAIRFAPPSAQASLRNAQIEADGLYRSCGSRKSY